jgi:hypothetical protein
MCDLVSLCESGEVVFVVFSVDLGILLFLFLLGLPFFILIELDEVEFDLNLLVVHGQVVRGKLRRRLKEQQLALLRRLVTNEVLLLLVLP